MAKDIILNIKVNADGSNKSIKELEKELDKLRKTIFNNSASTKEYQEAIEKFPEVKSALQEVKAEYELLNKGTVNALGGINENVNFADLTLGNLLKTQKLLNAEIKGEKFGTEGYELLRAKLKEVNAEVTKYQRDLRNSKSLQENITEAILNASRALDEEGKSISSLTVSLKQLENAQKQVALGSDDFKRLGLEINKVETELRQAKEQAGQFNKELNENVKGISGQLSNLTNVVAGGFGLTLALDGVLELSKAFAEQLVIVNDLTQSVKTFFNVTDKEAQQSAARIKAIADTFGQDYNEVLLSTNALVKQLGISQEEAFELIEKGFISGANANGDFLDQLKEYPAQFKAAGLDAEQFVAVISKAANEGVFSDKGADAVKEAALRLREQTTATRDALVGLFGEEYANTLLDGINTGKVSIEQAISEISTELDKIPENSKLAGQVIADVFGGAGEDAGIAFIKSLKDINGGLDGLIDKSNSAISVQLRQLEANKELATAQAELAELFNGKEAEIYKTKLQALLVQGLLKLLDVYKALIRPFQDILKLFTSNTEASDGFAVAIKGVEFVINALVKTVEIGLRPFKLLLDTFANITNILTGQIGLWEGVKRQAFSTLETITFGFVKLKTAQQELEEQDQITREGLTTSTKKLSGLINVQKIKEAQNQKQAQSEAELTASMERQIEAQNRVLELQKKAILVQAEQQDGLQARLQLEKQFEIEALQANEDFQKLKIQNLELANALELDILKKYNDQILELQKQSEAEQSAQALEAAQRLAESYQIGLSRQLEFTKTEYEKASLTAELAYQSDLEKLQNSFTQKLISEQEYNEQRAELDATRDENALTAQEEYLTKQLEILQLNNEATAETELQLAEVRAQIREKEIQDQIAQVEFERQLAEDKKAIQNQLIDSVIGFVDALSKSNKQFADLQKALFVFEKAQAIASVIINTQKQISEINAAYGAIPPLATALSIAAGASGALRIATIAATAVPELQQFGDGGLLNGKSHREGGININAEGGEAIINKRSTKKFLPVLDYINKAEGGAPLINGGFRRIAEAGTLVPNVSGIDTGGLNSAQFAEALSKMQIVVGVTEIAQGLNNLQVLESVGRND